MLFNPFLPSCLKQRYETTTNTYCKATPRDFHVNSSRVTFLSLDQSNITPKIKRHGLEAILSSMIYDALVCRKQARLFTKQRRRIIAPHPPWRYITLPLFSQSNWCVKFAVYNPPPSSFAHRATEERTTPFRYVIENQMHLLLCGLISETPSISFQRANDFVTIFGPWFIVLIDYSVYTTSATRYF